MILKAKGIMVSRCLSSNKVFETKSKSGNESDSVSVSRKDSTHQYTYVRIDAWIDFSTPRGGIFSGVQSVGIEDTGELNVKLDNTV